MYLCTLDKFILKRIAIYCILCIFFFILLAGNRLSATAGVSAGAALGFLRWVFLRRLVYSSCRRHKGQSLMLLAAPYAVSLALMVLMIIFSARAGIWMFAATAAGISLVPAAITINGITESAGITHNKFSTKRILDE